MINFSIFMNMFFFTSVCTLSITSFDIFRRGYVLSHSMDYELVHIDPYLASVPILYPLKTPANQKTSGVVRGYKMRTMTQNGLLKFTYNTKIRTCLEHFVFSMLL